MTLTRRELLTTATGAAVSLLGSRLLAAPESPPSLTACTDRWVTVDAKDGHELQAALYRLGGGCARLSGPREIVCREREDLVGDEPSRHGLLVPAGVQLDLNGSTLKLDLRSNSYGVRLSNDSALRNGTIQIIGSAGKGSQSCWHSGVSVGAAYGDGGTPDKPGKFSTVSRWAIEGIKIDQPFEAAAIQLMSEACHGVIRNVEILDSKKALLGIGMDWGSVGPITSEDKELPRMRKLWEQGLIYSTHPHDILIENLRVGHLLRNVDANDAGVRGSACHRITIRNVSVKSAATAVAIFGGDCGYEYARTDLRDDEHSGYVVQNVAIEKSLRFGLVLNGTSDNIVRARKNNGYDAIRSPVHPGINKPVFENITLNGPNLPGSQGIYAVALTAGQFNNLQVNSYEIGVHVEDWVRGMKFRDCEIRNNKRDRQVEGATEPAVGVVFEPA